MLAFSNDVPLEKSHFRVHRTACGKDFIGSEPFYYISGDDVLIDAPGTSTLRNLAEQVKDGASALIALSVDQASFRPHPLTWRLRRSARSSVDAMGLFSHEEFRDPDEGVDGGASGGAVERARGADVDEFGSDHPVVVGPGLPPEDGSCGQFAVQFHVSTSMLVGLKRIADMRGVSVPEVCRQVIGVFVAQQEGELGALLAAEAEVAGYRPSLGDA